MIKQVMTSSDYSDYSYENDSDYEEREVSHHKEIVEQASSKNNKKSCVKYCYRASKEVFFVLRFIRLVVWYTRSIGDFF